MPFQITAGFFPPGCCASPLLRHGEMSSYIGKAITDQNWIANKIPKTFRRPQWFGQKATMIGDKHNKSLWTKNPANGRIHQGEQKKIIKSRLRNMNDSMPCSDQMRFLARTKTWLGEAMATSTRLIWLISYGSSRCCSFLNSWET